MPQFSGMYSGPDRKDFDHYPTEPTLIEAYLDQWGGWLADAVLHRPMSTLRILDPCAGADARWGVMTAAYLKEWYAIESEVTGIDIQEFPRPEGVDEWHNIDFRNFTSEAKYDIIISNPPYGPNVVYEYNEGEILKIPLAEVFIYHGWKFLENGGVMTYLLNLDIQSGQGRYNNLWETHSPLHSIVCSRRPSFYGGKTSGNNYAIFNWGKSPAGWNAAQPRRWQSHLLLHERGKGQ